jgi:hypothetical protein
MAPPWPRLEAVFEGMVEPLPRLWHRSGRQMTIGLDLLEIPAKICWSPTLQSHAHVWSEHDHHDASLLQLLKLTKSTFVYSIMQYSKKHTQIKAFDLHTHCNPTLGQLTAHFHFLHPPQGLGCRTLWPEPHFKSGTAQLYPLAAYQTCCCFTRLTRPAIKHGKANGKVVQRKFNRSQNKSQ